MSKIIGVRFRPNSQIYYFDTGHFVLKLGDKVVVKTEQGVSLAEVTVPPRPHNPEIRRDLKKVHRLANQDDLVMSDKNIETEKTAFKFCLEKIAVRKMEMKLVSTEALLDGSKIIFFYTADGRVDFRDLVKDLVGEFRTRIEMRQIGVRHEAQMVGGIGCCGREFCCAKFLRKFEPVSVKMAKEQNLSLNPAKISGVCGRLMCCLTFEYKTYVEKKKDLPKLGRKINTRHGPGKVLRQNIMALTSTVLLESGEEIDISPEDIIRDKPKKKDHSQKKEKPGQTKSE